jgi:hypothetical protein
MAKTQDILALLDGPKSCKLHNFAGRLVGSIKKPFNPLPAILDGADIIKRIIKHGGQVEGKIFFEAGTGWVPGIPLTYWLVSAEKTITFDVNIYMQEKYIQESLQIINKNRTTVEAILGPYINRERFNKLIKFSERKKIKIKELLELCHIEYVAPGDAARTALADKCIDYHTSHNVYEHIPCDTLLHIILEGNRIIKKDGLFVNRIDYKDHFASFSRKILKINFLKYSDTEWNKYNNNKYVYVNRLRHDDFKALFQEANQEIFEVEPYQDEKIKEILNRNELVLDKKFQGKDKDILSTTSSWFVNKYGEKE